MIRVPFLTSRGSELRIPVDPEFLQSYLWTALQVTLSGLDEDGNEDECAERAMSEDFTPLDLAPSTLRRMTADCRKFIKLAGEWLRPEHLLNGRGNTVMDFAGYDLWMTQSGQGVGFWDGDWSDEAGHEMTEIVRKHLREHELYIGDDRKIWGGGSERE